MKTNRIFKLMLIAALAASMAAAVFTSSACPRSINLPHPNIQSLKHASIPPSSSEYSPSAR